MDCHIWCERSRAGRWVAIDGLSGWSDSRPVTCAAVVSMSAVRSAVRSRVVPDILAVLVHKRVDQIRVVGDIVRIEGAVED